MVSFYRNNESFFFIIYIFLLFGVGWQGLLPQEYPFLFFSEHRSAWADVFFKFLSGLGESAPYFIFTAYFWIKDRPKILLFSCTGFLVLLFSSLLKLFFEHKRPAAVLPKSLLEKIQFVDGVDILYGNSSFPSGHTMSGFAVFGLAAFLFEHPILKMLFALLAIGVGISRIYLIQHFPEDVLLGAMLGLMIGIFIYQNKSILEEMFPYDK